MSEENKDLGDKAEEAFENAKEKAEETFENAKEKASDLADDAKETAKEFTDSVKETFNSSDNKKVLAGILAILLGSFGVHKFILGYNKEGAILLGLTAISYVLMCLLIGAFLVWIPAIIGLIEGIIYLTKSDEEFYQTYQVNRKPWF